MANMQKGAWGTFLQRLNQSLTILFAKERKHLLDKYIRSTFKSDDYFQLFLININAL